MQLSASKEMITTTKSIHTIQNTQKQSSHMQIEQKQMKQFKQHAIQGNRRAVRQNNHAFQKQTR